MVTWLLAHLVGLLLGALVGRALVCFAPSEKIP
jgi:hypothetical protein